MSDFCRFGCYFVILVALLKIQESGCYGPRPRERVSRDVALVPFGAAKKTEANDARSAGRLNHLTADSDEVRRHYDERKQNEETGNVSPHVSTQATYSSQAGLLNGSVKGEPPTEKGMVMGDIGMEDLLKAEQKMNHGPDFPDAENFPAEAKLSAAYQELEEAKTDLFDARRRLNQTDLVFKLAQEIIRNAQNNVEQLKLENYQLARNFADEKLRSRMYRTELLTTKRALHELNGTLPNVTGDWDVKETVYNGEKWLQNWDGREPPPGQSHNVTATRVLLFLRHGHYEYTEPEEKINMSALGAAQMEALGKGLSGLRYKWHKTFIHSSKYRTQQAAEIVARELSGLDLKPSELIWSCAYDSDSERRQEAFKKFVHRASPEQNETSYELIMTHSSIIRYFMDRAMQIPFGTLSMPLVHGSITRLEIPPDGRCVVREYGEYSHMPKHLLTASNSKWVPSDFIKLNNASNSYVKFSWNP